MLTIPREHRARSSAGWAGHTHPAEDRRPPSAGAAAGGRAGRGVRAEHAGDEPSPARAAAVRPHRGRRRRARCAGAALPVAAGAVRPAAELADPDPCLLGRPAGRVQGARGAPRQRAPAVSATDAVTVSIDVDVEPTLAFAVFTE